MQLGLSPLDKSETKARSSKSHLELVSKALETLTLIGQNLQFENVLFRFKTSPEFLTFFEALGDIF